MQFELLMKHDTVSLFFAIAQLQQQIMDYNNFKTDFEVIIYIRLVFESNSNETAISVASIKHTLHIQPISLRIKHR